MKLNYLVISSSPEVIIKFFYEGKGKKYGEFYIRLTKEAGDLANPMSPVGVRGSAVLEQKHPEYAKDLLQALAVALKG